MTIINESVFFGATLTVGAYICGIYLQKRLNAGGIFPLLVAIAAVVAVLLLFKIEYSTYAKSAGVISYLLTPATVCLAVPLYESISALKKNLPAIFAGIVAGVITNGLCVLCTALLFSLDYEIYASFIPKSVTGAIGIGITQELGGITPLSTVLILTTGVFGSVFAGSVCRCFRITSPVAIGVAIGTSSHACGTVKALQMGKTEGAVSSLATAVSGLLTVAAASFFAGLY